jgi:hypothetical protein
MNKRPIFIEITTPRLAMELQQSCEAIFLPNMSKEIIIREFDDHFRETQRSGLISHDAVIIIEYRYVRN